MTKEINWHSNYKISSYTVRKTLISCGIWYCTYFQVINKQPLINSSLKHKADHILLNLSFHTHYQKCQLTD